MNNYRCFYIDKHFLKILSNTIMNSTTLQLSTKITNYYANLIGLTINNSSIDLLRTLWRDAKSGCLRLPHGISLDLFLAETEAIGQALKNGDVVLNPIPHTLYLRFNRLGINVDDDIKNAIASFGLQQALGAISHVDSFSHTIKNKKAAFLLRIEQPPVDIVTKLRSQMKFVERQMQTPQYQAISQDSFQKIRLKLKK